jgi:hypothetical protein
MPRTTGLLREEAALEATKNKKQKNKNQKKGDGSPNWNGGFLEKISYSRTKCFYEKRLRCERWKWEAADSSSHKHSLNSHSKEKEAHRPDSVVK